MSARLPASALGRIQVIKADTQHGASWIAEAALSAAAETVTECGAQDTHDVLELTRESIRSLVEARPGMASVRYWMNQLRRAVDELEPAAFEGCDVSALIAGRARELARQVAEASRRAAIAGAALITVGEVVITASYSATVVEALRLAAMQGRLRKVMAADSRWLPDQSFGAMVAEALAAVGAAVQLVPDAAISALVREADRALIGADSVFSDGAVLNGYPSRALAEAARLAGRSLFVVFERAKIVAESTSAASPPPQGMDLVPANLVAGYVTDIGLLARTDLRSYA